MNQIKTIYVKQSIDWHVAYFYLENMKTLSGVFDDKKFCEIYDQMLKYIAKKLDTHYDGMTKDIFVVVEQGATEEEFATWSKSVKIKL
ncbi:MAG: hypothetical protein K2O08_00460 [Clostridia bacterium]|nr:hypothetical protein [Clostridia bacterium]